MKFTEQEIEAMRKAAQMEAHKSIHDDYVYIGRERLEFTEQDLFYPYVRIMLPGTFLKLPEAFARKMYPSEYRPDVIKDQSVHDRKFCIFLSEFSNPDG